MRHMKGTSPARLRFAPGPLGDAEFAAHLESLSARILAGETNRKPDGPRAPQRNKCPAIFRAGRQVSWLDLRTLKCAGCGRTLLGPSDECVRAHAVARRHAAARHLPPPVAGRVSDRPVCAACLVAGASAGAA